MAKKKENLRKRINVRLVNNEKDILRYTSRPTHITQKSLIKNMQLFISHFERLKNQIILGALSLN